MLEKTRDKSKEMGRFEFISMLQPDRWEIKC